MAMKKKVCSICGSGDIQVEGLLQWDYENQEYVVIDDERGEMVCNNEESEYCGEWVQEYPETINVA